ncbi:hypothetical protein IFM89_000807 [Coptis chinensis]|uniref:Ribosomal protein L4 n=1 Tax=Coptis chinensis TaxID=261450 RepID=A0A835M885_9MAGN|nr:hypothetical protein IFM89_000807 [Coptis chinensis]
MATTAVARPLVTVQKLEGEMETGGSNSLPLPDVMKASIRPNIVNYVHSNISKNSRRPYAVSRRAGHQTSVESWGTGRAASQVDVCLLRRKSGGVGIGRLTLIEEIYDVVLKALAARVVPSLVLARGHKIENVHEIPLVVGDSAEGVEKTSSSIKVLKQIGTYTDVEKAKDSEKIRPGKGKMRNRRNIPGVEVANVERLNLLKLAPGGHFGRFIIWTKSAFEKLDSIYGSFYKALEKKKGDYTELDNFSKWLGISQ